MSNNPGYPDKEPTKKPPIEVGSYTGNNAVRTRPPQAAQFGKGAVDIREIHDATDQRRRHAEQIVEAGERFKARPTAARPDMAPPKP
jgi:hypothetical protein